MTNLRTKQMQPYILMLGICAVLAVFAFIQQTPKEIFSGLVAITLARGVLITDYIAVGGIGAAFMNGVIIAVISIIILFRLKVMPSGITIMSMFLTIGFAMFGKDLLNMLPLTFGTWLYSKAVKKPYSEYYIMGLLAGTLSPVTSELIFLNIYAWPVNLALGIALGTLAGFLFPMVSVFALKVLQGHNLYNLGFVGGMLAMLFVAILNSVGIEVLPAYHISSGNNLPLGILMYSIALLLIASGVILGDRKKIISDLRAVMKQPGTLATDFYSEFGANIYVNMGLLCILSTTVVLALGAELNGPSIAGILTVTGFGAHGKHLKNVIPLFVGAIISTYVNLPDPTHTTNVLAILFSSGLAPIAGRYGVFWGALTGFFHVCVNQHAGVISSGLNLYNNGFTAGFVVLFMVPIIEGFIKLRRRSD